MYVSILVPSVLLLLQYTECQLFGESNRPGELESDKQTDVASSDLCVRFRFEYSSLTPRIMQVMFCYVTFADGGPDSMAKIVDCIEDNGINIDDEDMEDVILVSYCYAVSITNYPCHAQTYIHLYHIN